MFVRGKFFQLGLMFDRKVRAYLSDAPLLGMLLALPTNIRPGWKNLPGTNTLAYYIKVVQYLAQEGIF